MTGADLAVIEDPASVADIRLLGLMMDTLTQVWAGRLGAGPQPGSPLANERLHQATYATRRLPIPIDHAWTFAQTIGLAATNHEAILRESLLRHANGEGTCPITVLDTLTRSILELLAVQAWLVDPTAAVAERFARWIALESRSARDQWKLLHPGIPQAQNQVLAEILDGARTLGLPFRGRPGNESIGTPLPTATQLAGALFGKYALYADPPATLPSSVGEMMYRLLSGGLHGSVGQMLSTLLPTALHGPQPVPHTYGLASGALWRAAVVLFLTTFVARSEYAAWLGIEIPQETRRLSLHHIDASVWRLDKATEANPH